MVVVVVVVVVQLLPLCHSGYCFISFFIRVNYFQCQYYCPHCYCYHFEGGFQWCYAGSIGIQNWGPMLGNHGIYFGAKDPRSRRLSGYVGCLRSEFYEISTPRSEWGRTGDNANPASPHIYYTTIGTIGFWYRRYCMICILIGTTMTSRLPSGRGRLEICGLVGVCLIKHRQLDEQDARRKC